jgi:hypothetical protein
METMMINGVEQTVKTANGVRYYQDFERTEGSICMIKPKTIKRYHEIKDEQPEDEHYGVFFAFGEKQFEEGRKRLIRNGYLKEGEKVCSVGAGMYGTASEISRFFKFYDERGKRIGKECNPQEVYFYEWNNHECMITMDDDEALKCVISYFGKEAAHKIVRLYPGTPTNVLAPLTQRDEHLGQHKDILMMLSRMKFDMEGFFNEGDCRRHRQDCLWGGCVKREMDEMRDLYRKLPDDIKDASCLSREEIEDYCNRLEQWAVEEFSKPEYDPVPRTNREDFPEEIVLYDCLYYKDDDGKSHKPTHIWFTHDSRRWHWDKRCVHGRAMTTFMGKRGTTLTKVFYIDADHAFTHRDFCQNLCDVSCKVVKDGYLYKLTNFHYE